MPRKRTLLSLVLAAGALGGMGGAWQVGDRLTAATNRTVDAVQAPAQTIAIASTDGITLAGTYWPSKRPSDPAVLLLHGNNNTRDSMFRLARWLNGHGFGVLTVDFRGHGESTPAAKSFGLAEADDAHAAFAWLRQRQPGAKIGVVGYSLGGAASVLGDHGPVRADALALLAVYPDIRHAIHNRLAAQLNPWGAGLMEPLLSFQTMPRYGAWPSDLSPVTAVKQVTAPVLVMGGEDDVSTPPEETRRLYEAVKDHAELRIIRGASHRYMGGLMNEDAKAELLAFLQRELG
ncbi:alpha/beta fold hydrolase [Altererythrobacter xixiisoli]|uniref:Alpha/beta fold hydrolase n=1 Tax=Croceibacterium xixiisoli TaxID=1476466 RepID=A0A6I4TXU1_9SPHN|nr:alpha/beta fold hydrolase [Croceibacterium xixiisoli]MXO99587.1 alpha/beta fold hydrolase [Croceibacterium xixiisoli]